MLKIFFMHRGKFIVIEGPNGVGKTTQIALLHDRLKNNGINVIRVPDQLNIQSQSIKDSQSNVAKNFNLENELNSGTYCLADNNYLSLIASQYYGIGNSPSDASIGEIIKEATGQIEPDLTIVLDAPPLTLKQRLEERDKLIPSEDYLERIRAGYLWEAKERKYPLIFSTDNPESVSNQVWRLYQEYLSDDREVTKEHEGTKPTLPFAIKAILESKISNLDIMPNDITVKGRKDSEKLEISSDSGKRALIIKDASIILASRLSQYKLNGFRVIPNNSLAQNSNYYVPGTLNKKISIRYVELLDELNALRSELLSKLKQKVEDRQVNVNEISIIQELLQPLARTVTVEFYATETEIETLIDDLLSEGNEEFITTAKKLLADAVKFYPSLKKSSTVKERNLLVDTRINTSSNIKGLINKYLSENYGDVGAPINLVKYSPKNELNLVANIVYEYTNISLSVLSEIIDKWPYKYKVELFETYLGDRLDRNYRSKKALDIAQYSWDLITSFNSYIDVLSLGAFNSIYVQLFTPRYGYAIPKIIEEYELTEMYEKCFDLSLELNSYLQSNGHELEAQYSILCGHKIRWVLGQNANDVDKMINATLKEGDFELADLFTAITTKIEEIHPIFIDKIKIKLN